MPYLNKCKQRMTLVYYSCFPNGFNLTNFSSGYPRMNFIVFDNSLALEYLKSFLINCFSSSIGMTA